MKAVLAQAAGMPPIFGDIADPVAGPGEVRVAVTAAAISHVVRSRAAGSHYSTAGGAPAGAGVDGVGRLEDGQRVYFFMPSPPYGTMAELAVVPRGQCLALPDHIDDVTAAAIGIPGVSSWAALTGKAKLKGGETVLINGATGASGRLAVQIAKLLGAGRVIGTGRNPEVLATLPALGADTTILLEPDAEKLDTALARQFAEGVDFVLDYLWGPSAERLLIAAARHGRDGVPLRYVEIGGAGGSDVMLPGAVLRSSAITLMGSGLGSTPPDHLVASLRALMAAAGAARLKIETNAVSMSRVAEVWNAPGTARTVLTVERDG